MQHFNYIICSNQMGRGTIGKVFKIRGIDPPHNTLIAKIYDQSKINEYEKEKNILLQLSNLNESLIKLNQREVILEHSDDYEINSKVLVFDYLAHGKLTDYIYSIPILNILKENHVKLICYKLLLGLKKCQEKNISHNKIDIKNIMFDNDFNPVIIHFSEASINSNVNFNKDFFGLGIVLAKLITSGKFQSIGFDKKRNKYFIKANNSNLNKFQKNVFEENIFWKNLEILNKIKVSPKFINFFDILIKSKTSLNIDDLLDNEWLQDIKNNLNDIELDFKKEFKLIHDTILDSQKKNKYKIDINSILNIDNKDKNNITNDLIINAPGDHFELGENLYKYREENEIKNKKYKKEDNKQDEEDKSECYINDINSSSEEIIKINPFKDINIQKINSEPEGIQFNYIEININGDDYNIKESLKKFMINLEQRIKNYNFNKLFYRETEFSKNNLGFQVFFDRPYDEEDENDEEIEYLIEDINNSDLVSLIIKIDLFKFEQNENNLNNKYYLMFNYIQGDIAVYYEYLNNIKNIATLALNDISFMNIENM